MICELGSSTVEIDTICHKYVKKNFKIISLAQRAGGGGGGIGLYPSGGVARFIQLGKSGGI